MGTDSVRKLNLQGHVSIPNSEIPVFLAVILVSLAEKVSDHRPLVTRPPPAGHMATVRWSRGHHAVVAGFLEGRNGNLAIWNGTYRTLLACGSA